VEAVRDATEAVQKTGKSVADAIEADRGSGSALYQLAELTRAGPLRSLMIAFVLGYCLSR
jgi:hypothetical protein